MWKSYDLCPAQIAKLSIHKVNFDNQNTKIDDDAFQ